jgi:hypothetical protein
MSDGMFLSACRQVSKDFPGIAYDEDLLDRVCLQVNKHEAYVVMSTAEDILIDCAKPPTLLQSGHGDAQSLRGYFVGHVRWIDWRPWLNTVW